jgi:RimJ/RimL family protein N-acetyltransferase
MPDQLTTPRLLLRPWSDADRDPFRRMNADPRVMEFFPAILDADESDALMERARKHFDDRGFGPFAAELIEEKLFIGFIGLFVPSFTAHFTPVVEIGWRLASPYWGRGLATEGARAVVDYAFESLHLPAIVSFTVPGNLPSRRVMEHIGMTHDAADDFDHPNIAEGHPLRRHVLYRLGNPGGKAGGTTHPAPTGLAR